MFTIFDEATFVCFEQVRVDLTRDYIHYFDPERVSGEIHQVLGF